MLWLGRCGLFPHPLPHYWTPHVLVALIITSKEQVATLQTKINLIAQVETVVSPRRKVIFHVLSADGIDRHFPHCGAPAVGLPVWIGVDRGTS